MNKKIKVSAIIILILLIASWSMLLIYISPEELVEVIGVSNSYLVLIIGGFLGGISLFIPFPNYLLVFTFGAAGLTPIFLGLSAALGAMLGESTSYLVGHASHLLLTEKWQKRVIKLNNWLVRTPYWLVFIVFVLLGSLPLPNDFLMVPLGLARYRFWSVIIPVGIGNIIFNTTVAYLGQYGSLLI